MAKKQAASPKKKQSQFLLVKALGCLTVLVSCAVMFIGGIEAGVRVSKIIYNCLLVMFVVGVTYWIVIRAMASYEEINGGKA